MQDVVYFYTSVMWLLNFFLVEITLKQELQEKDTSGNGTKGEVDQAVLHILLVPPLPLHLLFLLRIVLLRLIILILLLLFQEIWKASRPSPLSCRDL